MERLEITFCSRNTGLRAKSARYWNDIFADTLGRVAVSLKGTDVDSIVLADATLFLSDKRVVMLGSSEHWLDGAVSLLDRASELEIEGIVYQLRGFPDASAKEFRRRLQLLRAASGQERAAAVVVGDTALVHSTLKKARVAGSDRICMQLTMKKLGLRVESLLHRPSFAQRQAGFEALGIKEAFKGFELSIHHTLDRYTLSGIKGREYFALHISMREPVSDALFEFSGTSRDEVARQAERILVACAPKSHAVSVLHSGAPERLPSFAGHHWHPQPLGLTDSLSVLVEGAEARGRAQATA